MHYKLPLIFEPQPEGGFTVTSPLIPEGDTLDDARENARDALAAVLEVYREGGRGFPAGLEIPDSLDPVWADMVVAVPWDGNLVGILRHEPRRAT